MSNGRSHSVAQNQLLSLQVVFVFAEYSDVLVGSEKYSAAVSKWVLVSID